MVRTLDLTLTLIDDLVASERPATEGGHVSLDYLPGAMLLGAAAARLYQDLPRADAHLLFHSGRVRFGDGVPLAEGLACWPMPLCWHEAKGLPAVKDDARLNPELVMNLQHRKPPVGRQPKQLRTGHVRADGLVFKVGQSLRMKTAIDADTGRVDESQLFGYESISAGQTFAARIDADPAVPERLWSALVAALTGTGELLLGRSRSAEYGRVKIISSAPLDAYRPTESAAAGATLSLWCLSDLALVDENGQPTLEPSASRLGLACGTIDWDRSFLRFRRFAPWNAHRRAFDLERQVISRGSVIVLKDLAAPLDATQRARLNAGIGCHRESGMGLVSIDAELLAGEQPVFADPIAAITPPGVPRPDHPLIAWLETQYGAGTERRRSEQDARKLATELKTCYRNARAFAGIANNLPVGPSPAQWGRVYEEARNSGDLVALIAHLFDGDNAICKERGEGWQDRFRNQDTVLSFRDWFRAKCSSDSSPSVSEQTLRAFGREAQRIAQGQHGRGDHREVQS